MKKDLLIAVAVLALIVVFCFGVARVRADLPLTPSAPFSTATGPSPAAKDEHIVMRVNGEPITESEFKAFLTNVVPPQMQAMYASPEGRFQLSEQLIRLKVLEQEAKKRGLDRDPAVQAQLEAVKSQITAMAALRELGKADEKTLRAQYEKNKAQFETLKLRHIVVAYQGGAIPARNGQPLSQQQAAAKAQQIAQQVRGGADFAKLAQMVSDDTNTAPNGGLLGDIPRGELPPEVGTMLANLKPGEVSDPVPTQMGVHVFKLDGRSVAPFEQVQAQLSEKGQQEAAQKQWEQMAKAAKVERDPKFFAVPMQGGNRRPS